MPSEKILRTLLFTAVAAAHVILILFIAFKVNTVQQEPAELSRVMKVSDLDEAPPPPPPEPEPPPQVESIAETMIETEVVPEQVIVAPGTLTRAVGEWDDYLPAHRVSVPPKFNEREIMVALVYPPIALRSSVEGRVILELFVDSTGVIRRIRILQENPTDRGFGEAAVKAFNGIRGTPAYANGEPVSTRYRYPVSFRIR